MKTRRILICIFAMQCIALAQDRGTISGTITDSSGGIVPGAKVALQNPATNLTRDVVSANDGTYSFLNLAAGDFKLTVTKDGFRSSVTSGIHVDVNTTTHVDLQLQVGSTGKLSKSRELFLCCRPIRAIWGQIINNKAINDLPLFANGGLRSNIAFTALAPGVNTNLTGDPDTTGANIRIAGGLSNGASQYSTVRNRRCERKNDPQMRVVSAEGIEEFKVQSSAYSAEFGRASNGILNYTTKSGTNEFHGTAFAVIRNQTLNALGFFYTAPIVPKPVVHNQNLAGGQHWRANSYSESH